MTGWCTIPNPTKQIDLMDDSRPVFFSQLMYTVVALSVCKLRNCCFTNLDLWIRFVKLSYDGHVRLLPMCMLSLTSSLQLVGSDKNHLCSMGHGAFSVHVAFVQRL
mmetsp:Transcript_29818/g.62271  ORF Transcript_29818/g.62271 Transcript_29818/m.62271 type:complete len:106 (+) Transcript_29818:2574-2891(+)